MTVTVYHKVQLDYTHSKTILEFIPISITRGFTMIVT